MIAARLHRPAVSAARAAGAFPRPARPAAGPSGNRGDVVFPSTGEIQKELGRVRYRGRFRGAFRSTVFVLIVVAAVAVLVAVLLLPVLRIYGTSMNGTLNDGDIVVSVKTGNLDPGDVVAFYYNNNVLVKRVIANPGDWVDIDDAGNVSVNGQALDEPYLSSKAKGDTNIALPYQVPEGKVFVMGDNRETSVDSRNSSVGCVSNEQLVGKIVFKVWPFSSFGWVR